MHLTLPTIPCLPLQMWELEHLSENAVKYKLWPAQQAGTPEGLPTCTKGRAWLTTTMVTGCYNVRHGRRQGGGCRLAGACR